MQSEYSRGMTTLLPSITTPALQGESHDMELKLTSPLCREMSSDVTVQDDRSLCEVTLSGQEQMQNLATKGTNLPAGGVGVEALPGDQSNVFPSLSKGLLDCPDVLHVRIEQGWDGIGKQEGTQVFLMYQDMHTCGACNEAFLDLLEFLHHKTKHTLGDSLHNCELCKIVFMDIAGLDDHYSQTHRLKNFAANNIPQGDADDTIEHEPETIQQLSCTIKNELGITNKTLNSSITTEIGENNLPPATTQVVEDSPLNLSDSAIDTTQPNIKPRVRLNNFSPAANGTCQELIEAQKEAEESSKLRKPCRAKSRYIRSGSRNCVSGVSRQTLAGKPSNNNTCDKTETLEDEKIDFSFILQRGEHKGTLFTYGRMWFKCLHCHYRARSKIYLICHMRNKHKDMLGIHDTFDIKDGQESENMKLMRLSTYEALNPRPPIKINRTGRRCRKMEKQDIPGSYPCEKCDKSFSRLRYLRKHLETHRKENNFQCEECGKGFKCRTYLRVHKKVHADKLFRCNQCDFTSNINAAIHAHRQIHTQGSVLCDICGFAYHDKSTLNKHKRVHDVSRPYSCTFPACNWRFKTEMMCKAHIRAHTTEGKFKCAMCGYLFRHKHHLQRHETNMHGIQHTKSRSTNSDLLVQSEDINSPDMTDINVVISTDINTDELLSQQHILVATDIQGNPVAYDTDMSLNSVYQSLIPTTDSAEEVSIEDATVLHSAPEVSIDDQTVLQDPSADPVSCVIIEPNV